jgi:hypothetical protein
MPFASNALQRFLMFFRVKNGGDGGDGTEGFTRVENLKHRVVE